LSHGRNFRDARDNIRFRDPLARNNQPANHESHNSDAGLEKESGKFAEIANDAGENICDDLGVVKSDEGGTNDEDPGEVKTDEGGTCDANIIEHDRWAGKGTPDGDGDDFGRYEPYHGYEKFPFLLFFLVKKKKQKIQLIQALMILMNTNFL
jgi:hypothetical protein